MKNLPDEIISESVSLSRDCLMQLSDKAFDAFNGMSLRDCVVDSWPTLGQITEVAMHLFAPSQMLLMHIAKELMRIEQIKLQPPEKKRKKKKSAAPKKPKLCIIAGGKPD